MITFRVLRSTSAGNCTWLKSPGAGILIDCGNDAADSVRQHVQGKLDAIVITHVHTDHLSLATVKIALEHQCPIYMHPDMMQDLETTMAGRQIRDRLGADLLNFHDGEGFVIEDLQIKSFDLSHGRSATGPSMKCLGFTFDVIDHPGHQLGYLTDAGTVTNEALQALAGVKTLLIEANHDIETEKWQSIENPRMSWKVERVLSDFGHLSNDQAGEAIVDILRMQADKRLLANVFLMHLSETCNTADQALDTVNQVLEEAGFIDLDVQVGVSSGACLPVE